MLRLLTFGGLALDSGDGSSPRVRPQRLAILAILAASERGISRDRMQSLLWPDADEEHARQSLRQALYALRQELGADIVQTDALLVLDRTQIASDVGEFRAAIASGDPSRAAQLATGPFLDGFFLPGSDGFERWVEDERSALAAEATKALLALAKAAEASGDLDAAADWWRRLTRLDPVSGRFALGFLKALAARGDRAGALAFARSHESLIRRELEADPDPEIRRLESELRAIPSPPVVRATAGLPTRANAVEEQPAVIVERHEPPARRRRLSFGTVAIMATVALAAILGGTRWVLARGADRSTFAVGMIREDGIPDTLRIGGVLTDMLATNLARVAGLSVLSNTRLLELMGPGQDTIPLGYVEAARRAGATQIVQGRLLSGPQWGLALEVQRVEVATGIVRGAYRVQANDRYALVDSMTASIANDLRLRSPAGSVAEATSASPVAYRLYEEGLRSLYQYDFAAALRLFSAALDEDSTFAMAAYYDAILQATGDAMLETSRYARALRLAARLPERERLVVTAEVLERTINPAAVAVAESLSLRYPGEPQSYEQLSKAHVSRGQWAEARNAIERAIAIDSASEPVDRQACRLCEDLNLLSAIYFWWDSLSAAERTAERYRRLRPWHHYPYQILVMTAALSGNVPATHANLRKLQEVHPGGVGEEYFASRLVLAGDYETAWKRVQSMLGSPRAADVADGKSVQVMLLRQQGRLTEARRLGDGGPNDFTGGILALEQGDYRSALSVFGTRAGWSYADWSPGTMARHKTWSRTLLAMVLAGMGDTARLRPLADTVEYWGQRSNYGRDRRAHHYVRGMLLVAEKRDAEAATELREAIHSPTNGFTRVNYELGKVLVRLGRAEEAVPIVRAALHGELDGSSLYMSRTELHELLAQAFDAMGARDSAAVHYRAVARAWEHADPVFQPRRDRARAWLQRSR